MICYLSDTVWENLSPGALHLHLWNCSIRICLCSWCTGMLVYWYVCRHAGVCAVVCFYTFWPPPSISAHCRYSVTSHIMNRWWKSDCYLFSDKVTSTYKVGDPALAPGFSSGSATHHPCPRELLLARPASNRCMDKVPFVMEQRGGRLAKSRNQGGGMRALLEAGW